MSEQKVLLLGHPVGHSISPRFQQAAFDYLKLPIRYEACDTQEPQLGERVQGMRESGFLGANVTVPHKQRVLALVDKVSADVATTGAANCLVNAGGQLLAHNTDVGGFQRALRTVAGFDARGRKAVVIGAGGAARAVVVALCSEGAAKITVLNRSLERAEQLVSEIGAKVSTRLQPEQLDGSLARTIASCDLLVNCTSLGMAGTDLAGKSPLPQGLHLGGRYRGESSLDSFA